MFGLCESAPERLSEIFLGIAYSTRLLILVLVLTIDRSRKRKERGGEGVLIVNCRICPNAWLGCGFGYFFVACSGFISMAGSFIWRGTLPSSALRVVTSLLAGDLGGLKCDSTI